MGFSSGIKGIKHSSESVKIMHKELKKSFYINIDDYGGTIEAAKKLIKEMVWKSVSDVGDESFNKVSVKIKKSKGSHHVKVLMRTNQR